MTPYIRLRANVLKIFSGYTSSPDSAISPRALIQYEASSSILVSRGLSPTPSLLVAFCSMRFRDKYVSPILYVKPKSDQDHSRAATRENRLFAYAKTKSQISFAITAKLISAFVFATRIGYSLYFLNPKF